MDSIKIGIVTTTFFGKECSSGLANNIFLLSKELANKYGVDVSIFTPMHKGLTKTHGAYRNLPKKETGDGIHVNRIPKSIIDDYKFSPGLITALLKEKFDLIHSSHYGYFPATAGFIAAKAKHIPHIFTATYHPIQLTKFKSFLMQLYHISQGRIILKKSNKVLPYNYNEMEELKKITNFRYKIVPCPINNRIFYSKKVNKEKLTISYIGTLLPWKGAGIAFDICKEIEKERKDVRFVFVGSGYMEKELKRKASKRFTFLKNISNQELAKQYNLADVILYPTKYESFGRVLAEAMSCGTPIVSTKVGAVPETVGPGGMLVDYGEWNKMRDYVLQILDDNELRKKLGKRAFKHSRQYRDDIVAKKIFDVYKNILEQ